MRLSAAVKAVAVVSANRHKSEPGPASCWPGFLYLKECFFEQNDHLANALFVLNRVSLSKSFSERR